MRSRISFFNLSIFRKTLARFWPLWTGYFAFWLLVMLPCVNPGPNAVYTCGNIYQMAGFIGIAASFVASCAAAMAVFGFMYSPRSAGAMACLPVRREGVFVSCALAGLLPLLLGHVLTAAVCCLTAASRGIECLGALWLWCAAVSMETLFFFGFAAFCAQLTGAAVILPAVYAVLNLTAFVVETIVRDIVSTFVYGMISAGSCVLTFLSPPVYLVGVVGSVYEYSDDMAYQTGASLRGTDALALYALAGLALLLIALALYRRRRMESAGDVVAVRVLRPVFKYCMTFGCAIVLGELSYGIFVGGGQRTETANLAVMLAFLLVGAFIGYFGAQMLLKKSFRVFRSGFAGFGISCLVLAALMIASGTGFFGYEKRLPAADRIKSVELLAGGERIQLCEAENIASVLELHGDIVESKNYNSRFTNINYLSSDDAVTQESVWLIYMLEDGSLLERSYTLGYESLNPGASQLPQLQELFNCSEAIAYRKQTNIPVNAQTVFSAGISVTVPADLADEYAPDDESWADDESAYLTWDLTPEEAEELYTDCILPDMEDGTIGRIWFIPDDEYRESTTSAYVFMDVREANPGKGEPYIYDYFHTTPTTSSRRTNAWLEARGIPLLTLAEAGR